MEEIVIDPSPFQIVAHTSLIKVHSLFSLLGLNRAYVTRHGMLVGVIALKEVRQSIESATNGQLMPLQGESLDDHLDYKIAVQTSTMVRPSLRDVYEEDNSDYEDNLLGKLEVVDGSGCANIQEGEEEVVQPFAFSLASNNIELSTRRDSMALERLKTRRNSSRMDEMTTRRRSCGGGRRRSSLGGRRLSVFPHPNSMAASKEGEEENIGSSSGFEVDVLFQNVYDKSCAKSASLYTLKEVPSRAEIKV
ncbi:hypothetical protein PMAYCL1PPCAC_28267, partial [Pristionchus mayeri]